ncbi:MAG: flagellar motor protein MotB [bacterium]|nr:flagellar motor protein MotB [bacterium]
MKPPKKKGSMQNDKGSARGGWQFIYSGFVLILLCFFIMLSSFSSIQEAKIMRFVKSFVDAVSILPGGLKTDVAAKVVPKSAEMVETDSPLARIFTDLTALAERLNCQNDISIAYTAEGLVMRLSDHAIFNAGVADISPQAIPLLQKIGAIVAETVYEVRIEGHTDDIPIKTNRYPSNWELSTARAVNVLRYIIDAYRIPSERLSAAGFGEYQPIVANDSSMNRAQNRRVEIVFLNSENSAAQRRSSLE